MPTLLLLDFEVSVHHKNQWIILTLHAQDEVGEDRNIKINFDPPPPTSYVLADLEAGKHLFQSLQAAISTLEKENETF